jgi:hypothetical protein
MSRFIPSWEVPLHQVEEKAAPTANPIEKMSYGEFSGVVSNYAINDQERHAEAIAKADSYSWQIANPWYRQTTVNQKRVNYWLSQKGISNPMFADFTAATEALQEAGLLEVDEAALAQAMDGQGPRTFKGVITRKEYSDLDEMIAAEREASIKQTFAAARSDEAAALEALPIEQLQTMLREGERVAQINARAPETQLNGDA